MVQKIVRKVIKKKMSVHVKIDQDLIKNVALIVKAKNPLRKIKSSSKVVTEALLAFVFENEEFLELKKIREGQENDDRT